MNERQQWIVKASPIIDVVERMIAEETNGTRRDGGEAIGYCILRDRIVLFESCDRHTLYSTTQLR